MEDVLPILLVVAIILAILIGSVLGFVANARARRLSHEIRSLERRLDMLEAGGAFATSGDRPAADAKFEAAPGEVPPAAEPSLGQPVGQAEEPQPDEAPPEDVQPEAPSAPPEPEPAEAAAPASTRRRDFEEALGTRWAVWVGGIALALGGVFLVRYSIEAGLIGPGLRIAGGLLFAAALLAAGEWLRRSGLGETAAARRGAYVPGVLTAAGTVAAFATIYAAYILYGFLGDTAAFLALGVAALATLALALLHGPGLAGLGLAASYATPLLVSSDEPAFGALSLYLLVVTAATLAVARLKSWRWLAVTGVAGAVAWALFMETLSGFSGFDGPVIAGFVAAAYALAHIAFVATIHPVDPGRVVHRHDGVAVAVLALFALPVLLHIGVFGAGAAGMALVVGFGAATMTTAYAVSPLRLLVVAGIAVVLVGYTGYGVPFQTVLNPVTGAMEPADLGDLLATAPASRLIGAGAILGLFFGALGLLGVAGSASRTLLAVAGSVIPAGLLVLAYLRIAEFEISVPFGFAALVLAGYFAVVTDRLARLLPPGEHGVDGAVAAYAVMTVAVLAAGLGMMFERGVLTVALALVVPAIAMVEAERPVRGLRQVAVGVAAVVCLRFLNDPRVVGDDLGATPVFNWLLWGYGVPALAFAVAAWRFGRTRQDQLVPLFEALAVAFSALTAVMLIHHAMTGGDIYAPVSGLAEQSLIAMSLMAVSLGMQWLSVRRPLSPVFSTGTLVIGALGVGLAGLGLLFAQNPMFTGEPIVGGAFDGTLVLGYLLPAAMALAVARLAARRPDRPVWYVAGATIFAGLLAFAWATLAVRAAWHEGDLGYNFIFDRTPEGEIYAYSAVWLAFGLALLAIGAVAKSRVVRMVAAALVVAVVVKVFLIDTAGLTGALRAASFIGLGAVLVLVGLAYQRLLRRTA